MTRGRLTVTLFLVLALKRGGYCAANFAGLAKRRLPSNFLSFENLESKRKRKTVSAESQAFTASFQVGGCRSVTPGKLTSSSQLVERAWNRIWRIHPLA